jgi:hypothetical protein
MSLMTRIGAGVLSAGWLVPLGIAASEGRAWLERDLLVRLAGEPVLDSFPYLQFATSLVHASLAWVGLVIVGWTIVLWRRRA